jgi:hypothetical protein
MGEEGFSSDSSLLYHRNIPSAVAGVPESGTSATSRPRPNHPLLPLHLKPHDLFPASVVGHRRRHGRRLLLGNGDVRTLVCRRAAPILRGTATPSATSASTSSAAEGPGRDRVRRVRGGEGDYVILPRATTHRWMPKRPPRTRCAHRHRGQQPHRTAEALPEQVRPVPRARAVLRARPAWPQGPLLAEDIGEDPTRTPRSTSSTAEVARRAAAASRHHPRPALPPVRRRRLGRLPVALCLQHLATTSPSPAASTSRRRPTRSSRAGTSSSATSCRARSTTTRWRSRCPTTTPTSTPTR